MKDLKKMAEDIDLMKERMEEQTRNLKKAYREELEEIEVKDLVDEKMGSKHDRFDHLRRYCFV